MKLTAFLCALFIPVLTLAQSSDTVSVYTQKAAQLQLEKQTAWQRLMYAKADGQSEVSFAGYFFAPDGQRNLQRELDADVQALFQTALPDQSIRCRFPARSQWLIQQLGIAADEMPAVSCPALDDWFGKINPHKATLIYATDFMGNPSSMFGHTLMRIDPKNQQQLNLVSYAVNYAATVTQENGWKFAWKGLTGRYPGEYSIMPYYRKVKEYGDFESRDLWEYELNLSEAETQFLVKHIWEMQGVTFPYYFVSDNCAYRLLGLLDLVRPELNLASKFKHASIPAETIKAVEKQGLTAQTVYRPALETQLLAQARQHGHALSADAHALAFAAPSDMAGKLALYNETDRAKMLEMAYDDLYLYFTSRKVKNDFAQPRLRQLLVLRSQIDLAKQRQDVPVPAVQPHEGHHARNIYVQSGEVQSESFVALGGRAAYHDLIDPQGGYRIGTQLKFMDGAVQYRQSKFDVEHLDVLAVNSYSPVTAFKTPLSWGFNLGWQQEALDSNGKFSAAQQHGVANLNVQAGYSWANADRTQLCYAQFQTMLQGSKALDLGWRAGAGPVAGCQSVWSDHWGSTFSAALPYWQDSHEWNVRLNAQLQYQFNAQHALRLGAEYQQQAELEWKKLNFGYYYYY